MKADFLKIFVPSISQDDSSYDALMVRKFIDADDFTVAARHRNQPKTISFCSKFQTNMSNLFSIFAFRYHFLFSTPCCEDDHTS